MFDNFHKKLKEIYMNINKEQSKLKCKNRFKLKKYDDYFNSKLECFCEICYNKDQIKS